MERGYEFVGGEKPFKCKKCSKAFGSEGAWKLHGPCGSAYGKGKGRKGGNGQGAGCKKCGSPLRFLKSGVRREKAALDAGYSMVCDECEEVI